MTTLSENEVELTFRKACAALGWDYGVAEEFGRAAAWLYRNTDTCLRPLLEMAEGDQHTPSFAATGEGWQTQVAAALACVSAFDLLAAMPERCVRLHRLTGGLPAAAALAGAAAGSYGITLCFRCGSASLYIWKDGFAGQLRTGQPPDGLRVTNDGPPRPPRPQRRDRGAAAIDAEVWQRIADLAAQTHVPATNLSRRLGAGAEAGGPH